MKIKNIYEDEIVRDILKQKKSGKVLDFGCGNGNKSIALAKNGFEVTSVDISKEAINSLKEESKKEGAKIKTILADLGDYKLNDEYDIILGLGIFHFFLREKALKLIKSIKSKTNKDGLNIIDAFIGKDYFKEGELKKLYQDWKLINFDSYNDKQDKMNYLIVKNG